MIILSNILSHLYVSFHSKLYQILSKMNLFLAHSLYAFPHSVFIKLSTHSWVTLLSLKPCSLSHSKFISLVISSYSYSSSFHSNLSLLNPTNTFLILISFITQGRAPAWSPLLPNFPDSAPLDLTYAHLLLTHYHSLSTYKFASYVHSLHIFRIQSSLTTISIFLFTHSISSQLPLTHAIYSHT